MKYLVYRLDTGEIVQTGTAPDPVDGTPSVLDAPLEPGFARVAGEEATPETHRVVGGSPVALPEEVVARRRSRPPHPARWDWDALDWVDERTAEQVTTDLRATLMAQIRGLEQSQQRSIRELTLGRGGAAAARRRLEEIDDQIAALRAQLP